MRTSDRAQQRGLAGTVGPDKRDRFTFVQRQIEIADRVKQSVPGVYLTNFKETHRTPLPR